MSQQIMTKVSHEIGLRLIERLEYMIMEPQQVLNIRAGSDRLTPSLATRYPNAELAEIEITACLPVLPFANESMDLVFANQALQWSPDLAVIFAELQRIIRPGGCLMFSVLGLDTTHPELAHALYDMHPIGDALLAAQFIEPVVDMQQLLAQDKASGQSITYEVIYGQAWRGQPRQFQQGMDTFVPIDILRRVG